MKKFISSAVSMIIVAMCVLSVFMFAVSAAENTSEDSEFGFNFTSSRRENVTGIRNKDDTTSSYMYYEDGTVPFYFARVCGVASPYASGYRDFQNIYTYLIIEGEEHFMYNEVRENTYLYAVIVGVATMNGTAYGLWSPDSVYEEGVIPASDYYSHTVND